MNFDELSQQEEESFRLFQKKYFLQNPLPERPSAKVAKNLGFLFWGFILNGIAACLLAASRTGFQFYLSSIRDSGSILAQNVSQALGITEASLAVFAFEFGILLASIALTINSGKFDDRKLNIYIWIAVSVSLAAATARGLNLIVNPAPWLSNTIHYMLGFGIGPGATLASLASGAVVGQQYLKAKMLVDEEQVGYSDRVEEARQDMLDAWNRSDERAIIRTDIRIEAKKSRNAVLEVERSFDVPRGNEQGTEGTWRNPRENLRNYGSDEVKTNIKEYIAYIFNKEGRVAGPTEIAKACNTAKSYAHRVIEEWTKENSEAL